MSPKPIIVFVCEHGAAKSIVAAAHFNHLAGASGLDIQAVARGTNPDTELSEAAVSGLAKDGLTPSESRPQKLSPDDIRSAQQIVSFCELPPTYDQGITVEQWNGVPPVSQDYDKARDAILENIQDLLNRIRRPR